MFSSGMSIEHVSICLLKLPSILIAAPETLVAPAHQRVMSHCIVWLSMCGVAVPGTSAKLVRQPSAFAKRLQQTVRSHDGLRALLGHIAHAAKTRHCHSPILMVLACRFGLHTYIHTSSTAQGGGGSFKNRKPIGEVGCCESGMAERSH